MHTKFILIALCLTVVTTAGADELSVATLLPPPEQAQQTPAAKAMATVPVLKQPVQKGDIITPDNIITTEIPSAQVYVSTIDNIDELSGQQAVRSLPAGAAINRLHVRVAPMISRNEGVNMVFNRGGVELSARGQALEDGQRGESIRVMNPSTRSTILGTITAAGTVEIN